MIREIINFTKDLIDDIPDIMQWKTELSKGIHVVVEIDSNGYWINTDTSCYIYSGDDTILPIPVSTLIRYEQLCARIGTNMNKVLDKKKQIF